jgi:fumarate reductase subunit C
MDALMQAAIGQGLGYALFVLLLLYVLKTTGEREKRYQDLLDTMANKFNVVEDIKQDVKEIKNKFEYERK